MKITIDTKEDSHEEIRKVIRLLSHMVGDNAMANFEAPASSDVFSDNTPAESEPLAQASEPAQAPSSGGVFGNMFDNPAPVEKAADEPEKEEEPEPNDIELIEY